MPSLTLKVFAVAGRAVCGRAGLAAGVAAGLAAGGGMSVTFSPSLLLVLSCLFDRPTTRQISFQSEKLGLTKRDLECGRLIDLREGGSGMKGGERDVEVRFVCLCKHIF